MSVLFDIYGVTDCDLIYLEGFSLMLFSLNAAASLCDLILLFLAFFVVDYENDLMMMFGVLWYLCNDITHSYMEIKIRVRIIFVWKFFYQFIMQNSNLIKLIFFLHPTTKKT